MNSDLGQVQNLTHIKFITRSTYNTLCFFNHVPAYFLKKPSDFGQGLRASEKDSDRKRYDRNILRDERSALVQ